MAKVTFNDVMTQNTENNNEYKVGFFSLKDGESAVVRFAINTVDDFDIYTVHPITVGQSNFPNRRVSCLIENPKTQNINECPLCAKGEKVQQRFYIKMIQYVSENGHIVPKAVVWDRPAYSYGPQLKSYLDNYGPLSNIVCKITRTGQGLETRYDIIPNLNPQQYSEQMYPKDFSGFEGFDVMGTMVMQKNYNEIATFINSGSFPQRPETGYANMVQPNTANVSVNQEWNHPAMNDSVNTSAPWDDNNEPFGGNGLNRPTRY